jgi:multiple sugar transport system permease protein
MKPRATFLLPVATALAVLPPLLWLAQASGVSDAEVFETPWLPWPATAENYRIALFEHGAWETLFSSFTLALCVTLIVIPCAAAAAYSLVRLPAPGTPVALSIVAAAAFVPPIALLPGLRGPDLQLGSSGSALVLPYIGTTLPAAILLLAAFLRRLPRHLEESAALDGASPARLLTDILLPSCAMPLAALATAVFLYCWGELLLALPAPGDSPGSLSAALALAHPPGSPRWGEANALATLAMLPPTLAAWLLRRPLVGTARALVRALSGR